MSQRNKSLPTKYTVSAIILFIFLAFIMVSPQIFKHSMILGNDMMFHFNRFYEAYMQIKTGDFNYFQSVFGFDQSGRIVNALYGPDFAYLQGLLMFLTKNWFQFQLLTSFLCFFIAGMAMFFLAKKIKIDFKFSVFISVIYMSSSMVSYYALSQNMTSWGAAFAPFIYIPAVRAIQNPEKTIDPIELALAVTSVGFLHNLTLFLGILSSAPFYVIGFFRTKYKVKMIKNFFIAVLLTILININTLIGFAEVYLTNQLVYPKFFEDVLSYTTHITVGTNTYFNLGLVFSFIMLFQAFYLVFNWGDVSVLERALTITGTIFLIFSSNFLPWENIAYYFEFIRIIQFPRRFSLVAYILLLAAFAINLEKLSTALTLNKQKVTFSILCVIAVFMIANVNTAILEKAEDWKTEAPTSAGNNTPWLTTKDADKIRQSFTTEKYRSALKIIEKPTPDYLPLLNNITQEELDELDGYKLYEEQVVDNNFKGNKTTDERNRLVLSWQGDGKQTTLPVIIYSGSQVNLNGEEVNTNDLKKTALGVPIVHSSVGVNKMIIGYNPVVNMTFLFMVKFAIIIILFIFILVKIMLKNVFKVS